MENIANQDGVYTNFTGKIDYYGTKAQVKNATFELSILEYIWWHKGTWINGTWNYGIWVTGTWEKGTWKDGTWFEGKDIKGKMHGKGDSPDKWKE